MEASKTGWWNRHGWTVAILLSAFSFAFAVRTIWTYPVIAHWGPLYTYAGGSDSFYHSRVMAYIIQTHHNLIHDPMLKFPVGSLNPREPLFDWMNAVLGLVFAPFFGGNAVVAGSWFLDAQGPLWAALGVFPLYLIGREVSSRRTGLIAALIVPFLSGSIDQSSFGYANYLSFYTFVILVVVYSYIRMIKAVGTRRWVERYGDVRQYVPGLRAFVRTERTAVKWAVFTGVSLGALALAWQGYTYGIVVIGMTLLIVMLIERIRHVDSFGLYVATWIIGLVAFPMAMPYYLVQGNLPTFFDLPVLLFFGVLGLLLPFLLLRDVPWVFTIPFLTLLVGGAVLFLKFVTPRYFTDIITGQGYFVKNLIYSTVAEAQPPTFDALVLAYGVITFFLAFVGIAIFAYLLARHKFRRWHVALLVYGILSVYLPISATKFFLVGTPAYALLAAEAFHRAIDVGGYSTLRRTVASLSDRGSQLAAFRRAFKARHVLVLALVVGVILPNIWVAIDAGIPGNAKTHVEEQVNSTLPSWLKLNSSAPASNYLGAVGTALETSNQYDSAAYNWLATQDSNVPEPQRPAFISWWDYGFQAIAQGQHPSVADNFQNGIDPAGQFLLSQNESLAIGILTTALLSAEEVTTHSTHLPAALDTILANDKVNVTALQGYLSDTGGDYTNVVGHPAKYLPVNPKSLTDDNAMYLVVSYYLADSLSLPAIAHLYNDVQHYTGWSIRYVMSDSRLFPFSGQSTGIFYAPADLTGRIINSAGLPTTFFNVSVLGSDNQTYPLGSVPPTVAAVQYAINYFAPFYDSMIYRTYIGYNGTDIGLSNGIPGLSGSASSSPLEPGWMLQHFQIVYRTAYYCPGQKNATSGSSCMLAANLPYAMAQANRTNGTADTSAVSYFQGGETMLAYYPGETLNGTVTSANGTPAPGIRVTVYDGWHIPHMSVITGAAGNFTVVLPPGNDTVNLTVGALDRLSMAGGTVLQSMKFNVSDSVGYSFHAPLLVRHIYLAPGTLQGIVYWKVANSTSYNPTSDILVPNVPVQFSTPGGRSSLSATTDASGSFVLHNVPPANYTVTAVVNGHTYNGTPALVTPGATVNASVGLTAGTISGTVNGPNGAAYSGATVALSDTTGVIAVRTTTTTGTFSIHSVGPGSYTVVASVPGTSLRSPAAPVTVTTGGPVAIATLTLKPMQTAAVETLSGGGPLSGVSVRFEPVVTFVNSGTAGFRAINQSSQNGTVAVTTSEGIASVSLPVGNYSIYALGFAGSTLSAAIGSLTIAPGGGGAFTALNLTPALNLSGTLLPNTTSSSTTGVLTAVVAYSRSGDEVLAQGDANGSFSMMLPRGAYSLLGIRGSTASSQALTSLGQVNLTAATSVALTAFHSSVARFGIYANLTGGLVYAARGATVNVSEGAGGPGVSQFAMSNGSVSFFLPSHIPRAAGGYCLAASAPGYLPNEECGLTPSAISNLSVFHLSLGSVPVTLNVVGLPTGTSVTVNLTGESATAVNRTFVGGPRFSFSLPPGTYGVGASAVIGNGTLVYLPATTLNTTVPFGATYTNLTLIVIPQILAKGQITLPTGTTANNTTVTLTSSIQTVTVNGSTFLSGFRVAPGNYTASIHGTGTGGSYANLTAVSVSPGGAVTPRLVLTRAGVNLTGNLVPGGGSSVVLNTTVVLVGSGGATVSTTATKNAFEVELPPGTSYSVYANATVLHSGSDGIYVQSWSAAPGATCAVGLIASNCSVAMVSSIERAWLNGTLTAPGASLPVPGVVHLVGPGNATTVTNVSAPNGSFSVLLLPGSYSLYAASTSGSPLAGFATVLASPLATGNVSIPLLPTWSDSISLVAGTPGQTIGPATVTVTSVSGARYVITNVSTGATLTVALPVGRYTETATASGTYHGVVGQATASATVTVSSGNLGTTLSIAIPASASVRSTLIGPSSANVTAGGSATFSFTVSDSGNVPVTVHPVGAPVFWNFSFSIGNVTLTPGGASVTGEVHVTVPAGTSVQHPAVAISFVDANGTTRGTLTPEPTISIPPFYGVSLHVPGNPTAQAGTDLAWIPFTLNNSGNTIESIRLTIANPSQLAALGWNYLFTGSGGSQVLPVVSNVSAGYHQTYGVNLTFNGSVFIAPVSVTVIATVVGVTGGPVAMLTLAVPVSHVTVSTAHGPPLAVTGPGVGVAPNLLPEWALVAIVLSPTGALLVAILVRRWWKTRRWSRR